MKKYRGFTLIELLVVISIIGVLASVVLASFNTARKKSRDAKRIADLNSLSKAIELFYDTTSSYPREGCGTDGSSNGSTCTPGSGNTWNTNSGLASNHLGHNITEFIPSLPVDPLNNSTYYYQYEPHCATGSRKDGFWLRVRLEETGSWYYVRAGHQGGSPCPECGSSCW